MYVSKHYTCAEIDQRLLQGYYDDFVSAGFVGTIQEFWAFVLSIKDKPGTEAVQGLLDALDKKLQDLIKGVQDNLDSTEQELDQKIDQSVTDLEAKLEAQKVTKVSQLENDAKYQTEEQVKAYISALVNGADESLDTLLELAQALGNDPNFAATITEKLGQLKKAIEDETARAQEKEAELKTALETEVTKREEADANILKVTEEHVNRISTALQESFNNLDAKITALNGQFQALQESFHTLSQEVDTKISDAKNEAKTDNENLKQEIETGIQTQVQGLEKKISDEAKRATEAETALDTKIEELNQTHTDNLAEVNQNIEANKTAIQKEVNDRIKGDTDLKTILNDEAIARSQGDTDLKTALTQETLDRVQGDTDLKTALTQETADRKTADTEIKTALSTEKTERQAADEQLTNKINQLETKHDNELNTLQNGLDAEIARAKSAEESKVDKKENYGLSKNDFTDALLEKLNNIQEHANYITKVSELINDSGFQTQTEVEAAIQKVIGTAPEVLDTLQELAEALGNDPNFSTTILNRLAAITTDLNQEVEDRRAADDTLKLELLAKIKESTDNLNNSYAVLEERLNSYKTISDNQNKATNNRIDALQTSLNEKVQLFLDKVTELSTQYTEKVTELQDQVNKFTTDILARVNAQNDLINGNSANIQKNLELIQGLTSEITGIKDTANKNLNQLLEAIRSEADTRKSADDTLSSKIDVNTQKLDETAKGLEELETYVKENPTNVTGSSTIDAQVQETPDGKTEKVFSVKLDPNEPILSKESTGLKSNLGIRKTQQGTTLRYEITGVGGNPLPGVDPIDVPEAEEFTEAEAHAMYTEIYGNEYDPEAASNLVSMTEADVQEVYNEVYN